MKVVSCATLIGSHAGSQRDKILATTMDKTAFSSGLNCSKHINSALGGHQHLQLRTRRSGDRIAAHAQCGRDRATPKCEVAWSDRKQDLDR